MNPAARRGSLRPNLATIFLSLWIVLMGTAVPFPLFLPLREALEPSIPLIDVVRPYLASLMVLGSRTAVIATNLVAGALDWESAVAPTVAPWLLAAQRIGAVVGMVVAATLPAWLLVVWSGRPVLTRGGRVMPTRRVPLAVALVWTVVVARPLIGIVGAAAFPVDTWLMLPSAAQAATAPSDWCAFRLHPSVFACEAERLASTSRKDENVQGFGFAGARCISAADVPRPACGTTIEPEN